MTHLELVEKGLHNTHIRFSIGNQMHYGVVVDDLFHKEGKTKRSHYTFIPTSNLRKWHEYQKLNDKQGMYSLSSVVDIELISWGERIGNKPSSIFSSQLFSF